MALYCLHKTLERLIKPLGIYLAELFNDNNIISLLSENERQLTENYCSTTDSNAKLLFELSEALSNK